jgi:hypothetical protein
MTPTMTAGFMSCPIDLGFAYLYTGTLRAKGIKYFSSLLTTATLYVPTFPFTY